MHAPSDRCIDVCAFYNNSERSAFNQSVSNKKKTEEMKTNSGSQTSVKRTDEQNEPRQTNKSNCCLVIVAVTVILFFTILIVGAFFWTNKETSELECGTYPGRFSPIINGTEASLDEFPHYVAIKLRRNRSPHCGGSIISPNWVLTAKHCVQEVSILKICKRLFANGTDDCFQVVSGTIDSINTAGGTVHDVIAIVSPTEGLKYEDQEDISLLMVSPPFKYKEPTSDSRGVTSVCLPEKGEKITEKQFDLVGFGRISEFHSIVAKKLMKVRLNHYDVSECFIIDPKRLNQIIDKLNARFVCAGVPEESKSGCKGDSGGPLTVSRNNRAVQIGIYQSHFKTGCGDRPGSFVNVMFYREWIREKTGV